MNHQVFYKNDIIHFQIVPKKIQHIYIKIYPDKNIIVSAPPYTDLNRIKNLIIKKGHWICKKLNECEQKKELLVNNKILLKGHYIPLEFSSLLNKKGIILIENKLIVNKKIKNIKKKLENFLKEETFNYIANNIQKYSNLLKVSFKNFKVKKIKKWGYCKRNGELVFNLYLIALPHRLIHYILLHEIAHLIHFNHSRKFNNLLLKHFPDKKLIDKELKKYHLQL